MKDVATLIWEIAKADKTMDGLTLKEMFHKKVQLDQEDLRLKLKEIVARQIRKEPQPYKAEIALSSDPKHDNYIFGGMAQIRSQSARPVVCSEKFIYRTHQAPEWIEVTNIETQMLIDAAVIPLGLKWKIQSPNFNNVMVVSWKHWHDES